MVTLCVTEPTLKCQTPGCDNDVIAVRHYYNNDDVRVKTAWRRVCNACHINRMEKRNGVSYTKLRNSWHPYLWARLDYCENQDGRLGFICNAVLPTSEMLAAAGLNWTPDQFLQVDHINGNPADHRPENLQTLCSHCHTIKGMQHKDWLTPGRKSLNV